MTIEEDNGRYFTKYAKYWHEYITDMTKFSEIKEDLKEINDILKKMQKDIKLLENKC